MKLHPSQDVRHSSYGAPTNWLLQLMHHASHVAAIFLLFVASTVPQQVSCGDELGLSDNSDVQQSQINTTVYVDVHSDNSQSLSRTSVFAYRRSQARWLGALTNRSDHFKALVGEFDWHAYLAFNPDLAPEQYGSQEKAWQHYRDHGHKSKRLMRLPEVVLRYTAATGLTNQHYCHIAAFSLCAAIAKCSVVLPPALARSSFQDAFSVFKTFNKVEWYALPTETLYDTEKIVQEWGKMGFRVWQTPPLQGVPTVVEPESAFPRYVDESDPRLVVSISNVYLRAYDLPELQNLVTETVVQTARSYMLATEEEEAPYVVVDLPVTLFMLRTNNNLEFVSKVANKLYFAPILHQLADKVLRGMAQHAMVFNGAHLRVEADAMDWARSMGGFASYWGEYIKAMRTAEFNGQSQLYVATGLLSYEAGIGTLGNLTANLTGEGLCDRITFKEQYLSEAEMRALHSEQKALIDLLVLAKADHFVGFEPSTFSFFLSQYRVSLEGRKPSTSVLVEGKIIGTNPLFESAAPLVENGFQQQKQEQQLSSSISSSRRL